MYFEGPSFAKQREDTVIADLLARSLESEDSRYRRALGTASARYATENENGPLYFSMYVSNDGLKSSIQKLRAAVARAPQDVLSIDVELGQRSLAYRWWSDVFRTPTTAAWWWALPNGIEELERYHRNVLEIDWKKAFPGSCSATSTTSRSCWR